LLRYIMSLRRDLAFLLATGLFLNLPTYANDPEREVVPPEEQSVDVVVRLRADVASGVRGAGGGVAAARGVDAAVRRFGGTLRPQHPGAGDPALGGYFVAEAPSAEAARALAADLLGLDGVEAAYVKPQAAMP
jgi:hypothetical protein